MFSPLPAPVPEQVFKSLRWSDIEIRSSILLLIHDYDQRSFEVPVVLIEDRRVLELALCPCRAIDNYAVL